MVRIEKGDLVRAPFGPLPEDQVDVLRASTVNEAADQHSGVAFGQEAIGKLLRRGHLALEHLLVPRGTFELAPRDPLALHCFRIAGVEDVFAINPILAERHGVKRGPERAGLPDRHQNVERSVKSAKTSAIETSAVKSGAGSRERVPRPFWIVSAIDRALEADASFTRSHPPSPDPGTREPGAPDRPARVGRGFAHQSPGEAPSETMRTRPRAILSRTPRD